MLTHGERRYESGFTVVIRSDEDASFNLELAEVASEFEGPAGHYTLLEINLEESSIKVNKHSSDAVESEIRILKVRADDPSQSPQLRRQKRTLLEEAENLFDSMF